MSVRSLGDRLVTLALAVAGCEPTPVDIEGTYRVTGQVAFDCQTGNEVSTTPLRRLQFVAIPDGFELHTCDTEDLPCRLEGTFTHPIGDVGWRRYEEVYVDEELTGLCVFHRFEGTARFSDDPWLTIELTNNVAAFPNTAPECVDPLAMDYTALPCAVKERLLATPVEMP